MGRVCKEEGSLLIVSHSPPMSRKKIFKEALGFTCFSYSASKQGYCNFSIRIINAFSIDKYYELLTDEDRKIDNPREAKIELAKIIVGLYHGPAAGESAKHYFIETVSHKKKPEDIPELRLAHGQWPIVDLLLQAGVKSKSEARRLIEQGGVKIDDTVKNNPSEELAVSNGSILQIGKRKFFRIHS